MSGAKVEVEKFNGRNNFGLWSVKMKALLTTQGLAKALEGKAQLPETMRDAKKDELMEKAKSIILLNLSDEVLIEVAEEEDAAALWAKLQALYVKKGLNNRLYMLKRMFQFRYTEGTSIRSHLDEFNKLMMDLKNVGKILDDEEQGMMLLASLPESWEHFTDSLLQGRTTITSEEVKSALFSKEWQRKLRDDSLAQDVARGLVIRGRDQHRRPSNRSQSKSRSKLRHRKSKGRVKCFECHEEGHIRRDCPKLRNKRRLAKCHKQCGECCRGEYQ
ncbi:hypothetical protein ACJRO7_012617 [Eucalyptus globulus]|uniref:CCHC-type domain-containing protein n=1 Tax=Eucalyptus globulus TaxID=34317 RepID=A0ABD3LJ64_EUCGL